jgi:hypothetical protein
MSFKVSFTDGSWRIIDADVYSLDERLVVFLKDSEPILTAVVANVLFFEPVAPEPEKSSLDDAHYGLLFGR